MTRWLEHDEKVAWRRYLAATRMIEDALDRQLRADSDLPLSYYEVLVRLSAQDDRAMRMSELADQTLSSRSRLSHAVGRLEALGYVRRAACEEDGRGLMAHLTDEGFAALADAAPGHVEEVRTRLLDPLTDEQLAALSDICRTLVEAMGLDDAQVTSRLD